MQSDQLFSIGADSSPATSLPFSIHNLLLYGVNLPTKPIKTNYPIKGTVSRKNGLKVEYIDMNICLSFSFWWGWFNRFLFRRHFVFCNKRHSIILRDNAVYIFLLISYALDNFPRVRSTVAFLKMSIVFQEKIYFFSEKNLFFGKSFFNGKRYFSW